MELTASNVIPPVEVPPDTRWVKRFKIQSPCSPSSGDAPIYLGATVLLPARLRPGHHALPRPLRAGALLAPAARSASARTRHATSTAPGRRDDFPRVIVVTFQHPTPYFDDSYAVNSVNVGPYGDALLQELIPEVEKRFRVIDEPWARWLSGRLDRRLGVARAPDLPPRLLRRHVVVLPRPRDVHERRGLRHLRRRQRVRAHARVDHRPHPQLPRDRRLHPHDRRGSATTTSSSPARTAAPESSRTSGRPSTDRSAKTATSSRSTTSAPGRSTPRSPTTGATTTTCSST